MVYDYMENRPSEKNTAPYTPGVGHIIQGQFG